MSRSQHLVKSEKLYREVYMLASQSDISTSRYIDKPKHYIATEVQGINTICIVKSQNLTFY